MKRLILAFVCVMFVAGCGTSEKQTDTTPESTATSASESVGGTFTSYESALQTAKSSNKYIFVDIYTDWCTWCKKLDKDVYSDPKVQAALRKNFASTKLNAESSVEHTYRGSSKSEQAIATSWNVDAYPTLVFLDPSENPVFAYAGYLPADQFLKLLDYVSTGAYKTTNGDFQSWLSKQAG